MAYIQGKEDDFISSLIDHVSYCENQGWTATFQEAYRIDEAHVVSGDYAGGFCAEECIPRRIESSRLRVKPAGTYLQWLNCIDLTMLVDDEGETPEIVAGDFSSSEDNPMFAAYDALHTLPQSKESRWWVTCMTLFCLSMVAALKKRYILKYQDEYDKRAISIVLSSSKT